MDFLPTWRLFIIAVKKIGICLVHQKQLHKIGLKWAKPEVFEKEEVGQVPVTQFIPSFLHYLK